MNEQYGFISERKRPELEEGLDLQHFANYDLVRRIDVGGMGEVYLARQRTAFGREVAVKIIRPDLVNDATARQRFLREAEVASYLKHDHILPLLEFGEEQGRLFIVTPYIKDGDLAQRLALGSLPVTEVHELFSALCRAVSYLHKRGIVHRDLKPANILLDKEEDSGRVYVRLIDFGIASSQGVLTSGPLNTSTREFGTADYMAPERLLGVAAPSNDIFSLGVILHVMLTGELPHPEATQQLPIPLMSVIDRCLEVEPDERFLSVDDLLLAFEHAYKSLTASQQMSSVQPIAVPATPPARPAVETSRPALDDDFDDDASTEVPIKRAADKTVRSPINGISKEITSRPPVRGSGAESTSRPPVRGSSTESTSRPPTRGAGAQDAVSRTGRRMGSGEQPVLSNNGRKVETGEHKATLAATGKSFTQAIRSRATSAAPATSGGTVLPRVAQKGDNFGPIDYDAPTTEFEPESIPRRSSAPIPKVAKRSSKVAAAPATQTKKRKRRGSALVVTFILIGAVLLLILGISYLIIQASVTANVTLSPKVQSVNGVFTFVARPGVKSVNSATGVIPASVFTSSQKDSRSGRPTGVSGCVLGIFECKQTVSLMDVSAISAQLRPSLKYQISQDLHKQANLAGATTVGDIFYSDGTITANPPVGTVSKTVTVTMTEQGSMEYVKSKDVQSLALQMLKRKLLSNYTLIDSMTRVGQPVVQSVNANGEVKVAIAAAGVSRYQISETEMTTIKNQIKGMSVKDARAALLKHSNLDATTLAVHLSYGNNVPTNIQQIKIITVDPTNVPTIQLPAVPKPSGT
ncbi:hypothetical protein KDW_19920 [Dictyobacter vulcani]|uniref:non-specific serine/threonine protein kinase n=1 Tax=Dictyobacter vulcani TaxID=2607529 RepID=A0A5J4KN42_9CHLR|nr:serine/threonine-protein kinase [Dictyobacter vulcani]GER87830.1 hypothetical protein KDW_19920 [Dictyobacter vulcani]